MAKQGYSDHKLTQSSYGLPNFAVAGLSAISARVFSIFFGLNHALDGATPARNEWDGILALDLTYRATSGSARVDFIEAMRLVLQSPDLSPVALTHAVVFVTHHDLTLLDGDVRALLNGAAAQEFAPLQDAVANYTALRAADGENGDAPLPGALVNDIWVFDEASAKNPHARLASENTKPG